MTNSATFSVEERRSSVRMITALTGRIIVDKRLSPIECMVRDLSDDGARIDLREEAILPYEFEFEVLDVNLSVQTRVAWASGRSYGLIFIGIPQLSQEDRSSSSQLMESTPTSEAYTRTLTFHLTEAQYERLRRCSFERRLRYQELMERALRTYLSE